MSVQISLTVNGTPVEVRVEPHWRLIDLLRGPLRLPGTKEGCGEGECGACTVLVDGRAINSCLYPVLEAAGRQVTTVEGLLGARNRLSTIQQQFVEHGAIQCGFCTPGMVLATHALLTQRPDPSDAEIRTALVGNLCRCTGYVQIVEAVHAAADRLRADAATAPNADAATGGPDHG